MKTQLTTVICAWLLLGAIARGHEPLGHRGPTYEVTSPVAPEGRCLRLDIVDQATGRPIAARFSLAVDDKPYVRSDRQNDFDSWKQAVRSGKTFVTSGPIIRLDADGVGPGQTLHLPPGGGEVTIEIQLAGPRPPESLELIQGGEVVPMEIEKRLDSRVHRWLVRGRLRIDKSCWLAARGQGVAKLALERETGIRQNTMAHTAAVRVLVGEAPIRSYDDAEFLIDHLEKQLEFYSTKGRYRAPEHKERMLQLIREAIARLESQ